MENNIASKQQEKIGIWPGSWLLLRASWSTLKVDKELVAFPLMSAIAVLGWFFVTMVLTALVVLAMVHGNWQVFTADAPPANFPEKVVEIIAGLIYAIGSYMIANYYTAALVASAIHRFEGNDPTVKYGLAKAKARWKPLLKFSLVQAVLGTLFRLADERLPLLGRVSAWVVGMVWSLASFFAVPVIVMAQTDLGPIEAVKRSAGVFKKTWGQNFIAGLGMGIVFLIAFLAWTGLAVAGGFLAVATGFWTLWISIPILLALFVMMISIFTALNGIFTAALYHFATTGQSPAEFDHNLLMAAFYPKKRWFA